MSCCSDAPPGWLVRFFVHLGLPLPGFLRVQAKHYTSAPLVGFDDRSSQQLLDERRKDASTGSMRSSSKSNSHRNPKVPGDSLDNSGNSIFTWDANSNSSSSSIPLNDKSAAEAASAYAEKASRAATALRAAMCAMPQQLQVWGEYFCRRQERWIACAFFSSSLMIHDAADWLAGRTDLESEAQGVGRMTSATRAAPRALAAARLKNVSRKRLAAFLGVSPLFLATSAADAAGTTTSEGAGEASNAATEAARVVTNSSGVSGEGQTCTAKDQGVVKGEICDFLPTIKGDVKSEQQQQVTGKSCLGMTNARELQTGTNGDQKHTKKTPQETQKQEDNALRTHQKCATEKKEDASEKIGGAAAASQEYPVGLGQLLLFTRPRKRQQAAATDGCDRTPESSRAALERKAAGSSSGAVGAITSASDSDAEKEELSEDSSDDTSSTESVVHSPSLIEDESARDTQLNVHEHRLQEKRTESLQRQQSPLQLLNTQSQQQEREQQLLQQGEGGKPQEMLLPVERQRCNDREDEGAERAVASSLYAEGRHCQAAARGKKEISRSAFLCCFPAVVELPPLLFFFHSPCSLSIIIFPVFSAATPAAPLGSSGVPTPGISSLKGRLGEPAAAAESTTCGNKTLTEAVAAKADDFARKESALPFTSVDGKHTLPAIDTRCGPDGRCCAAAAAAVAFPSEGAYSFSRGQVLTFSIPASPSVDGAAAGATDTSCSSVVPAHPLSARAAGGSMQRLHTHPLATERISPVGMRSPLALNGAGEAPRGAATAVLLVLLLLLRRLQQRELSGILTPPQAVVDFVSAIALRFLSAESASVADECHGMGVPREKDATGASSSGAAEREKESRMARERQQLLQQREQNSQHLKFPFEFEEERYTLAAELSAAWKKAASSSSSSSTRKSRSNHLIKTSSSRHRLADPTRQHDTLQHPASKASSGSSGSRLSDNQGRGSSRRANQRGSPRYNYDGSNGSNSSSRREVPSSASGTPLGISASESDVFTSSTANTGNGFGFFNTKGDNGRRPAALPHPLSSGDAPVNSVGYATSREQLGIDFLRAERQRRSRGHSRAFSSSRTWSASSASLSSSVLHMQHASASLEGTSRCAARSYKATEVDVESHSTTSPHYPPGTSASRRHHSAPPTNTANSGTAAHCTCDVRDRSAPSAVDGSTAALSSREASCPADVVVIPSEDEVEIKEVPAAATLDARGNSFGVSSSLRQQSPPCLVVNRAASPVADVASSRNVATASPLPAADAQHPSSATPPPSASERPFVLAIDETERITDVSFRYASSWRRILERRQRRLQHWWMSAAVQRLLLPLEEQRQHQAERRKRQKQQQEEQPQQRAGGLKERQPKMRRNDAVLSTRKGISQEAQHSRSRDSSECRVSNDPDSEEEHGKEDQQQQNIAAAKEDLIFFEDEDTEKPSVPQEQEQQDLKGDEEEEREEAKYYEKGLASHRKRTRNSSQKSISSAREGTEREAAVAPSTKELVLEGHERANKEERDGAAEEIVEEQHRIDEEASKKAEEKEREELLAKEPLPTTRAGFRFHPKFVLSSDLKPFEYIPPGIRPAAFFSGELVFLRADVDILKSEKQWLRLRRRVKAGEEPLRVVTSRIPQLPVAAGRGRRIQWLNPLLQQMDGYGRIEAGTTGDCGAARERQKVGLYAEWQTEVLPPLRVENGVLPVNERGNVEVGKLGSVPVGAVHISLEDFYCEGEERSGGKTGGSRNTSTGGRKQRTCLSAASLGGALAAAAAACGVQWAPAVVGFELDTKHQLQPRARWIVQRDGIIVLEDDEARVRQRWAEERIRREKAWQQRRQRREQLDREEAAMRWRVLCRAALYWREQQQREQRRQGDL